jgi:hypothetical protein
MVTGLIEAYRMVGGLASARQLHLIVDNFKQYWRVLGATRRSVTP